MKGPWASLFDLKQSRSRKDYALVLVMVLGVFIVANRIDQSRCLSADVVTADQAEKLEGLIENRDYTHRMTVKGESLRDTMVRPERFEEAVADWRERTCAAGFVDVRASMADMTPGTYGVWAVFSKPAPLFQTAASIPVLWLLVVANAQRFRDAGKSYGRRLLILAPIIGLGLTGFIKPEPYLTVGIAEVLPQRITGPAVMVISYLLFWAAIAWIFIDAVSLKSKPLAVAKADRI